MKAQTHTWWIMFLLGLVPLVWLLLDIEFGRLGANPTEAVEMRLGNWALRFLCLNLAVTPFVKAKSWKWLSRYRRMIGLYTFFYATLHVLSYVALDHALAWRMIGRDIIESPYIIMGLMTYLILLPMAITSTLNWQRQLGGYWKKLHRLIYIGAITAVIHYAWQLKGNLVLPLAYALIISLLLGFRVLVWLRVSRRNQWSQET
jgi:methionine sulfoxide reductase heme-binding subunit